MGVDVNKSAENNGEVSTVEADTSIASAIDGHDKSLESARVPTTNSGSLSASPVESVEAGFYKVRIHGTACLASLDGRDRFEFT